MSQVFQIDTNGTLTTSLQSYWKMEGNSNDFFGGSNGTDTSISYSTGNGKVQQGAGFNGTSSKMKATISSNLNGSFTLNVWVKVSSTSDSFILQSRATTLNNYWAAIYISSGKFGAALFDGTHNPNILDSSSVSTGTWYMLTFVRDTSGGKIHLYKNGTEIGTGTTDTTTSVPVVSDFLFGAYETTSATYSQFITGDIDEVGMWFKVLSSQEKTDLYNSGSGQTMINQLTSSMSDSILRGASRSATIARILAATRTPSDSVLNGASRSSTVSRLAAFTRTASASISNAASRFATLTKGLARSLSDSIMNADSRLASLSRILAATRSPSDSIINGASRSSTLSRIAAFTRTLSDSISNSASRFATVTRIHGFVRTLSDDIMIAEGRFASVRAFINGIIEYFKPKYSPQGTVFQDKYSRQDTEFETKYQ